MRAYESYMPMYPNVICMYRNSCMCMYGIPCHHTLSLITLLEQYMQESRQWILVENAILMTVWKETGYQLYESESFNYFFMPDHRIKESPSSTQNHRFLDVALGFHPAKCFLASDLDDTLP